MNNLTIAYITARKEPRLEWFLDSLSRQHPDARANVLIIDNHPERALKNIRVAHPKPSVWQGPHRLTAVDFFSASNARNTALCLCKTDWIALVDDLSVLMPGWLEHALAATQYNNTITCGAFRKVKGLEVEAGLVKQFTHYEDGLDWRVKLSQSALRHRCIPEWFFGCSFVAPLNPLLEVNGYPEYLCDGMGYEDTIMGAMLGQHGVKFRFDPEMTTWESEDDHHNQPQMMRIDPGISPDDKSHKARELAAQQETFHQNFGWGSGADECCIRRLRDRMLSGGAWPVPTLPDTEWFSKIPLSEFHHYPSHD